jgi:uncharacterized protein YndB with AHSA1/START domain
MATKITVSATINAPVQSVWDKWTIPHHITKWNFASDDWHCPKAENDLRVGGKMNSRMEAKDGSFGFDFEAIYDEVIEHKKITYTMEDARPDEPFGRGRQATTTFENNNGSTTVTTVFDPENENPAEMQQGGWQAILNNFKKHVEGYTNQELLRFEATINAPVEKVYTTMLAEKTYREWTAEFNPTSRYRGSWDKGSKILFIGIDKDGIEGGMVSRIKENIPNKFLSIEHLGLLQGDKEITAGKEVEGWAGALENYTFIAVNGGTRLVIEMDANIDFKSYFEETWPKALNKLKEICEQ